MFEYLVLFKFESLEKGFDLLYLQFFSVDVEFFNAHDTLIYKYSLQFERKLNFN